MDQVVSVIWDAAKCLCGCAQQEAHYVFDLQENLQKLHGKWENLEGMKKDVEVTVEDAENSGGMRRSDQVHNWLQKIEGIQQEIIYLQDQGTEEIQNKCQSKCCPKNCVQSYKLGKSVAKMIKNVDELATEGKRFGLDFKIAHRLLPKSIEIPLVETVGLDLMFDKVWNSIEAENIGVIGLYGMGGVGKTTLLKKINNELGKRMLDFHAVMWMVVSKEPNLDNIMGTVRKLIGIGDNIWNDCSSQEEKAAKIYQVLKRKKFVLLLDDIWERLDLNMVGVPNPKETNFQSKVLFTTRSKDVCAKMQAQRIFKVEILTKKEAIDLFSLKVGEETLRSHPDIPKLAEEMAAECNGLPLALIVVGSAMAGVKSLEAWEHSKNNLTSSSWTASDLETKVFSILKFSYDRLPDETHKNCFKYCALYPEDYEIEVLELIDQWIGEGFVGEDITKNMRGMHCQGESVIEKLKLSCLLESTEEDIFLNRTIKIHDVIRDMALWLARDQDRNPKRVLVQGDELAMGHDNVENQKNVERISFINDLLESEMSIAVCPNVQTFFIRSRAIKGLPNIQYMSKLKVLQLHVWLSMLPVEIGGLVLLEYLSLMGGRMFTKLPLELKKLKNLKIFSLWGINVDCVANIPLGVILCLEQLRVLRFSGLHEKNCGDEREFLQEFESLPNLEELQIELRTENGLNKLLESSKLNSCVWGLTLDRIDTPINMPLLLACMSKMKHLQEIRFEGLKIVEDSFVFETCCLSMLRRVVIQGCNSLIHLTWLSYAPFLQQLSIYYCESMEEVIKDAAKYDKGKEKVVEIFSSLVELTLSNLPKLKTIHMTALSFPFLRSIKIENCPNLKKLPFDSNSAKDKLRHIKGDQDWWDNLEWEDPAVKHTFQSKFQHKWDKWAE